MSLLVDIEKRLHSFCLQVKFEAGKEILALLGASGCGKSMTLKCIAGIEKPDRGRIVLDGQVLFDSEKRVNLSPQKRRVGYLFQNYALFPHMTVEQNIRAGMGGITPEEKRAKTAGLIKRFYLEGLERQRPPRLSGGQQQRVALARILASEPRLLLLDEPFSALDTWLRWQLEQEMTEALDTFPGATLFVSHNRNEVYRLCNRIGVIADGKLQMVEEKWDLFNAPKTVEACLLTGCKNISPVRMEADGHVTATDWGVTFTADLPADMPVRHMGIRAHYFIPMDDLSLPNTFAVTVERVIEDTFSIIVMVKPKGAPGNGRNSLIRWELPKELWRQWERKTLFLHVPEKSLLLLQ